MAPLAAHLSGIAIDWRDTDGRETAAVELAEFSEIGDQRVRGDIADTLASNPSQQRESYSSPRRNPPRDSLKTDHALGDYLTGLSAGGES